GVGGNKIASQYVGINLKKIQYIVFTLGGGITGLAGFLWVARYAAAQSETAIGFEFQTIAACVIGGVSIAGGSGTIIGVVLGAFFMGIVYNALTMINVSPFWQMAIQGFIILFAIIINTVMDKRNQQLMLRKRSFNE
ncbi:ABC transporter permease, partial [bacterium]|nr:ABC transporter permease [bacterium]